MGRLLVSVRGQNEALAAPKGSAHIADVEYPHSALAAPYRLNVKAVCQQLDHDARNGVPMSTNTGEEQAVRRAACQAVLGVAPPGSAYVKCRFAGLNLKSAICPDNGLQESTLSASAPPRPTGWRRRTFG